MVFVIIYEFKTIVAYSFRPITITKTGYYKYIRLEMKHEVFNSLMWGSKEGETERELIIMESQGGGALIDDA